MTRVLQVYILRVFGCLLLFQHASFPFRFRFQVGWMTQEYFLQFFLAAPGILQRVARRTYTYLGVGSGNNYVQYRLQKIRSG